MAQLMLRTIKFDMHAPGHQLILLPCSKSLAMGLSDAVLRITTLRCSLGGAALTRHGAAYNATQEHIRLLCKQNASYLDTYDHAV